MWNKLNLLHPVELDIHMENEKTVEVSYKLALLIYSLVSHL